MKVYSSASYTIRWSHGFKLLTISLVLSLCAISMAPPAWSQDTSPSSSEGGNASGAGMQAAAWLLTVPYGVCKVAFAIGGGIVGGLTYVFTGGNENAAKSVWTTSMYGTYLLTPEHLQGDRPIRFLGVADSPDMPAQTETPYQEPVR
ncbi:hypothetical protein [Petrachloros mirabilis]